MKGRYRFFILSFVFGLSCMGMEGDSAIDARIDTMVVFFNEKYKEVHRAQAVAMSESIGGIKAVVSVIGREDFKEDSKANEVTFTSQEVDDIYAQDKSLFFVSIYENNGNLISGSAVNTAVRNDCPVFIAQRMAGEVATVGLQKNEQGIIQAVRAVRLNIRDRFIRKYPGSRARPESEEQQWNLVLEYYRQASKRSSRLIRDRYGNLMLREEPKKRYVLEPEVNIVYERSDQDHLMIKVWDAYELHDEHKGQ